MSKHHYKTLMLLPLLAICLSGCYEIIPEDAPEEIEDEFTPEGSYTLPEEDTSESSSIPYESTGGDSSSSPSETPGGDSSSDSGKPSEPDDPSGSSESDSSSSSTPSETHEYSYSLQITNKDNFTNIYIDEDNPENNTYIEDYSLQINLYTLTDDVITNTDVATINDVSITSSDESVVALDGLTLIPLKKTGSATISVYWLDHSEAVDAFTCSVTYKAHEIVTSYEYELVINNKETLLNESWTTADSPREINVSVLKSTLKDGQLDSKDELENPNISLTQENLTEGETNEILLIDGLNVTPKNPGSVRLTASWIEGEDHAEDYFDIIVSEAYYEGDYTLEITDPETFGGTDDNPWYIGTSRELDVTLSYSDYAYSDNSLYNTYNKKASIDDVTISVYGVTDNEVVASADDDLTWYSQNGEIMLSPVAANYDHYLVVVAWNLHPTATDYVYVHTEMPDTYYTLTIDNENDLTSTWYLDDNQTRTLQYTVHQTTLDETSDVSLSEYQDSMSIWTYPSGYVSAVDNKDGTATLSLDKLPNEYTTVTVYVMWNENTSAIGYVELDLHIYSYEIEITNSEILQASWSLEDNETRAVEYKVTKDNTQISELGTNYLELSTNSVDLVSLDNDNLSIKAIGVGTPTVTLTLYNEDRYPLATDSVLLNIDNVIKATSITLSTDSITLNAYYDTASLSATVLGANNEQATEQGVTWSVDNTGIVLTDGDDNSITVSVTGYNIEGTITCTSEKDPNVSATCSVVIGDQPNPDGPQAGDTTYKLGCKKSDGSYVFFDGTISSSHLQITEDWEQAADVYVTPNKYEMSENGCTLSFYDSNGTLQYLASSESSSSKGNMKLSTTPYRWVWDSYNGYSFFSAPAFEDRYIGLSSSDDFRTYAQSSLSSDVPVYPYSEIPEDYDYGNEEEPETGEEDGTYVLAALCDNNEYRYFNGTVSSNHAQTTTTYSEATRVTIDGFDQTQDCSCVLTYKDSSGSTKYLAYGGSGTNVSASSSSYTWNWSVEDGCFYASTDSTRYLSNQTGYNYFSAYTSSNGTYKVVPYAEDPVNGSPTGLTINSNSNQVIVGHELQLTATVLPEGNVNNSITWSSSDESYASVDQTGLVTGNAVCESVTITATLNGYPEITDSITLTIVSEESKEFIESDQFKVSDYSSSYDDGTSLDGVSFALNACSFKFNKNGGTATAYYSAGIRFYRYNQIIFTNPDPSFELIDTITITCTTSSYMGADNGVAQNGSITATDTSSKTITITADYSNVQSNDYDIIFQNCITGSSNTQLRFTQIDITYKRA